MHTLTSALMEKKDQSITPDFGPSSQQVCSGQSGNQSKAEKEFFSFFLLPQPIESAVVLFEYRCESFRGLNRSNFFCVQHTISHRATTASACK
jgi:hypothetical protein